MGIPVTTSSVSGSGSHRKRLFFHRLRGKKNIISRLLGEGVELDEGNEQFCQEKTCCGWPVPKGSHQGDRLHVSCSPRHWDSQGWGPEEGMRADEHLCRQCRVKTEWLWVPRELREEAEMQAPWAWLCQLPRAWVL